MSSFTRFSMAALLALAAAAPVAAQAAGDAVQITYQRMCLNPDCVPGKVLNDGTAEAQ